MASNEIKPVCRTLRQKAFREAERIAGFRISRGFGDVTEALEEHARFVQNWPRMAKHITRMEFVRAYRAASHWSTIRRMRASGALSGGVGIGTEEGRKERAWRSSASTRGAEALRGLVWNPYTRLYMPEGVKDSAVITSLTIDTGLTRAQAAKALRRARAA